MEPDVVVVVVVVVGTDFRSMALAGIGFSPTKDFQSPELAETGVGPASCGFASVPRIVVDVVVAPAVVLGVGVAVGAGQCANVSG